MAESTGRLIVLSGPSGVGKGTLLARYRAGHPGAVSVSVSATTRAPRPGEKEGVHYFFVTEEQFCRKIEAGGMLEWARYNNHYYGTPREPVERALAEGRDVVLEIEVQGGLQVRQSFPAAALVFVAPPGFGALRERLAGRGTEDAETVARRLAAAAAELERAAEYDFLIVNGDLDEAARAFGDILRAARFLRRANQPFISEVLSDAQTYFVADQA